MNERIRKLRRFLDLTQQEFADRIGMKRNTIANYETDRNEPSTSAIALICREFNVSEEWLRTGAGEMFAPKASDALDALAKERGISRSEHILIEKFLNLKPESRQAVMDYILEVAAAISASDSLQHAQPQPAEYGYTPETPADEYNAAAADIDIEAEVAKYRAELERQKKAADDLSVSDGSKHVG